MKTRHIPLLILLCACALWLTGCAFLDSFFGVAADGTTTGGDGRGASGAAGALLSALGPWGAAAGGLLGVLRWGYAEVRSRKLDGAARAAIAGVTEAVDKGVHSDKAKLYEALTAASRIYANRGFFADLVNSVKKEVRAARAAGAS